MKRVSNFNKLWSFCLHITLKTIRSGECDAFMTCLPYINVSQVPNQRQNISSWQVKRLSTLSTCGGERPELEQANVSPSGHLCFELLSCPHQNFLRGELGLCQFGILPYSHCSALTVKLILAPRRATCS